MKPKYIEKDEWSTFFDSFNRTHTGWTMTLELLGTEIGAQIQDHELIFEGIVLEGKEKNGCQIMIMAGERPDGHITHRITRPLQVSFDQNDQLSSALIMIEAGDGVTTLIKLYAPAFLEVMAGNQALAAKV